MQLVYVIYVLALFTAAFVGAFLAVYTQRFGGPPAARPFRFLMGCVSWWGFFAGLSAIAPASEGAHLFGVPFRFSGVILISSAALLFALAYCGHTEWLRLRRVLFILAIPLITLVLNWTAGYHHLFVYDVVYERIGGVWLRTSWNQGAWFQLVYTPYNILLMTGFLLLLLNQARRSAYPYRQQASLIFAGALVPSLAGLLTTFDLLPGPDLDLIVLGFLVMGLAFGWALFRFQLLDILPIARSTVIENIKDAMLVLDSEDRVVELNPALYRRLGLSRREAIGLKLEEIFDRWPELVERYKKVREGGMVITVPANNRIYHFDVQISPINKKGQQVGRLFFWRDVTVLKETELALAASLQRLGLLFQVAESLSDFTHLEDLFQTVVDRVVGALPADRVLLIIFKRGTEEVSHYVVGGRGADMAPQLPYEELMEGLTGWVLREGRAALSPKGEPDPRESAAVRRRRQETNCGSIMVVPLLYREKILGTITAINQPEQRDFDRDDVDLLQAMAAQAAVAIENIRLYEGEKEQVRELMESNEALDAFSHMVAHDLKGPLGIVIGYAELMLMDEEDFEVSREDMVRYARTMLETGHKMSSIINELLMLARVRREEDLPFERLDTGRILEEALTRLKWQMEQAQARIVKPERWPAVVGYGPWVEEVWVNYIHNAIKYGGERPEIVLGFDENDLHMNNHIRFWVKDNGSGMTAEEQQLLFTEFSRVGERKIQGHGLGLAIVRRIMERMGGTVGVESEPGVGSLFYFTLPGSE